MPFDLSEVLVVGISSRALFDLRKEDQIFREEGLEAYSEYQIAHEQELLGSGGMLAANRDFVDGEDAFLVVYADNASTMDVGELVGAHELDVAATLALFRVADPERRGVVALDAAGCVSEFVEKPARPRSNLAWAGLLVGSPELLTAVPEDRPCDLGRMVLPTLVGRMRGVEVEGYHADIGTPESYGAALRDFDRIARSA